MTYPFALFVVKNQAPVTTSKIPAALIIAGVCPLAGEVKAIIVIPATRQAFTIMSKSAKTLPK
jgi:hypothetical protein